MIEPALTVEEWKDVLLDVEGEPSNAPSPGLVGELSYLGWIPTERRPPAAIAILNAALPDSDPRKITREMIGHIRNEIGLVSPDFEVMERIADALASYLPPEP